MWHVCQAVSTPRAERIRSCHGSCSPQALITCTYAYIRGRVVVESVKITEIPEAGEGEWPLEPFCEDMCHDLFDAQWEVRHGAAMAIRDVLKYHSASAGRCVRCLLLAGPPEFCPWFLSLIYAPCAFSCMVHTLLSLSVPLSRVYACIRVLWSFGSLTRNTWWSEYLQLIQLTMSSWCLVHAWVCYWKYIFMCPGSIQAYIQP